MSLLQLITIAIVQGLTEFLPISSSGHLALIAPLTGWQDQGLLIDVAVHVGTLLAVMIYFRRDMGVMLLGFFNLLRGRIDQGGRLVLLLILATLPVVGAGFALKHFGLEEALRRADIIAWTMLGFGILLYLVDRASMTVRRIEHMTAKTALFIGLAQVLALIPGTSRSGITMTAARFAGYERAEAARFSMLMSIPTIIAAGTLGGVEIWQSGDAALGADALIVAGLAMAAALVAIAAMMRWLQYASFTPFVIYRIALGLGLLAWVYL